MCEGASGDDCVCLQLCKKLAYSCARKSVWLMYCYDLSFTVAPRPTEKYKYNAIKSTYIRNVKTLPHRSQTTNHTETCHSTIKLASSRFGRRGLNVNMRYLICRNLIREESHLAYTGDSNTGKSSTEIPILWQHRSLTSPWTNKIDLCFSYDCMHMRASIAYAYIYYELRTEVVLYFLLLRSAVLMLKIVNLHTLSVDTMLELVHKRHSAYSYHLVMRSPGQWLEETSLFEQLFVRLMSRHKDTSLIFFQSACSHLWY